MKAILIDAVNKEVREVEVDKNNQPQSWYKLMGCDIVEAGMYVNDKDDCIMVDEEGMLKPDPKHFFYYQGAHQPFAGNGLIVGIDSKGESIAPIISLETVKVNTTFLDRAGALTMLK